MTRLASEFNIRPLCPEDATWVAAFVEQHWGDRRMVVHGEVYWLEQQPGFAAFEGQIVVGLVTYRFVDSANGKEVEILSLDSLIERRGIGGALLDAVRERAIEAGCRRLWLVTTNDNLHALRFYQKRGWVFKAIYPGAVGYSRCLKPSIPWIGNDGIPIRDELVLEQELAQAGSPPCT